MKWGVNWGGGVKWSGKSVLESDSDYLSHSPACNTKQREILKMLISLLVSVIRAIMLKMSTYSKAEGSPQQYSVYVL